MSMKGPENCTAEDRTTRYFPVYLRLELTFSSTGTTLHACTVVFHPLPRNPKRHRRCRVDTAADDTSLLGIRARVIEHDAQCHEGSHLLFDNGRRCAPDARSRPGGVELQQLFPRYAGAGGGFPRVAGELSVGDADVCEYHRADQALPECGGRYRRAEEAEREGRCGVR